MDEVHEYNRELLRLVEKLHRANRRGTGSRLSADEVALIWHEYGGTITDQVGVAMDQSGLTTNEFKYY